MNSNHKFILLLSSILLFITLFSKTSSATGISESAKKTVNIYNNKEPYILKAPDSLIQEKSFLKKAYIFLIQSKVCIYNSPSSESECIDCISKPEPVNIIESTEKWYRILYNDKKNGYILKEYITDDESKAKMAFKHILAEVEAVNGSPNLHKGQELVNSAKKHLGTKYVYGGSSPKGFDCSGFVQYVCKSMGISVSRTAASQFSNGVAVNKNELLPGDLLFFAKNGRIHHVGIYAGDGRMIHAPHTGDVVKFSDFNTPYRQREFVGARRVF